MLAAMNTVAVKSIIADSNAERVKAEADYFAIILDPTRTSDQDRADLATAMRVLGKTPHDAYRDQQTVTESRELADLAQGHPEAQRQADSARDSLNLFLNKTKAEMLAKIDEIESQKRAELRDAVTKQNSILGALLKLRRHRFQHANLRGRNLLAAEPAGSPARIDIDGHFHDPTAGVNPHTGI